MKYISVSELKQHLDNGDSLILIDVREPYEREICEIGGMHIPMAEVSTRLAELNTEKTLAFLCRTGKRAEAVANLLQADHDILDVAVVEGGILAWIEEIDNTLESY